MIEVSVKMPIGKKRGKRSPAIESWKVGLDPAQIMVVKINVPGLEPSDPKMGVLFVTFSGVKTWPPFRWSKGHWEEAGKNDRCTWKQGKSNKAIYHSWRHDNGMQSPVAVSAFRERFHREEQEAREQLNFTPAQVKGFREILVENASPACFWNVFWMKPIDLGTLFKRKLLFEEISIHFHAKKTVV